MSAPHRAGEAVRERWAITAGTGAFLLITLCSPVLLFASRGDIAIGGLLWNCLITTALVLVPMPIAIAILQRSLHGRSQIAAAFWYIGVFSVVVLLNLVVERPGADLAEILPVVPFTITTPMLLYFAVLGVVRARVWYRRSLKLERERRRLESEEASRTRQFVEQRSRPATVGATLSRIEQLLPEDPAAANALVQRLARYARTLMRAPAETTLASSVALSRYGLRLRGVTTEITIDGPADSVLEHADLIAIAIEKAAVASRPHSVDVRVAEETVSIRSSSACLDELHLRLSHPALQVRRMESEIVILGRSVIGEPRQEPRQTDEAETSSPIFATLVVMTLVCGSLATFNDLRAARISPYLAFARTFAVCGFIVAGPLLGFLSVRAARLSFPAALMTTIAAAFAAGAIVTKGALIASARVVGPLDIPAGEPLAYFTVYVFWRTIVIAGAVATIALAHALSRVLMARKIEADRFHDEVALAEVRELEARFHPHCLFNSLTSIAALIGSDPAAAARMCRRLSDLVEEIVGSAGTARWPLREELRLAASYLSVQRMRFGERIQIESWDVPPAAADVEVPRLILQPLLENMLKHAVARHDDGTSIGLRIRKRRRYLTLDLWNDVRECGSEVSFGRGLTFVLRSVEAAGGQLTVDSRTAGRFAVHCSIPR